MRLKLWLLALVVATMGCGPDGRVGDLAVDSVELGEFDSPASSVPDVLDPEEQVPDDLSSEEEEDPEIESRDGDHEEELPSDEEEDPGTKNPLEETPSVPSVPTTPHPRPPVQVTFSQVHDRKSDPAIVNHMVRLIHDTPPGAEIRVNLYSISKQNVIDELIEAKKRGVKVFVTHSGHDKGAGAKRLEKGLGDSHRWCDRPGNRHGCISNHPSGLAHSKFWLFSRTKDANGVMRSDVTMFGSANVTPTSGTNLFNNMVTVYDDKGLYEGFRDELFGRFWANTSKFKDNDFFDVATKRGYFKSSDWNAQVFASPETDSDLFVERLKNITPGADCRLRVMQSQWTTGRLNVARQVASLKRRGCTVSVVVHDTSNSVVDTLKGAGIPVRREKVHDKTMLIYARYEGSSTPRAIVLTGSHNLTLSANKVNDEILVELESTALFTAFEKHFAVSYNAGSKL